MDDAWIEAEVAGDYDLWPTLRGQGLEAFVGLLWMGESQNGGNWFVSQDDGCIASQKAAADYVRLCRHTSHLS